MSSAHRVAVVQAAPVAFDVARTLEKAGDRDDIARARLDFDAVGHYARPDVFRLIVDESSRTPVAFQPVASAAPASDRGTDK